MEIIDIVVLSIITLLLGGALAGIFLTKTPGFGRYTTSAMLLVLVLFITALALFLDKIEVPSVLNVLFAVAGYAGGMLAGREQN